MVTRANVCPSSWLNGLLGELSRHLAGIKGYVFVVVLANAALQNVAMLPFIKKIIFRYYAANQPANPFLLAHYGDFQMHHVAFVLYTLLHTLSTALLLFFLVTVSVYLLDWLLRYCFSVSASSSSLTTLASSKRRRPRTKKASSLSTPPSTSISSSSSSSSDDEEAETSLRTIAVTDTKLVKRSGRFGDNTTTTTTLPSSFSSPEGEGFACTTSPPLTPSSSSPCDQPPPELPQTAHLLQAVLRLFTVTESNRRNLLISLIATAISEMILLALYMVEVNMLADMSVHVVDIDMVDASGLSNVLTRRKQLGFGIDTSHNRDIFLLVVATLLSQVFIALLSLYLCKRISPKGRAVALVVVASALLFLLVAVPSSGYLLQEKVIPYENHLPWNFWHAGKRHIPVAPDLAAYPAFSLEVPDDPEMLSRWIPHLSHKPNVIIVGHESLRMDYAGTFHSPATNQWLQDHQHLCFSSTRHLSTGHVSETGQFGYLYALYPHHYHQFNAARMASFPIKVLRENGYLSEGMTATAMWPYPNKNVYRNFDNFNSFEWNDALFAYVRQFLEENHYHPRQSKTETGTKDAKERPPLFFSVLLHRNSHEIGVKELHDRNLMRDKDRVKFLQMLEDYGVLDDAVLIITGDHGDMHGEHGEVGHGQPESSWWNEKILVPLHVCHFNPKSSVATSQQLLFDHRRPPPTLSMTSHIDIFPTIFDILGLGEKLPPDTYSDGKSLLLPKDPNNKQHHHSNNNVEEERPLFLTARYFPEKNKINAVVDQHLKWWFRYV
ncbi:Sulfatase domain-containing protein [Balamuthia mandrillaris]